MTLKLIKEWNEVENIKNTIKDRDGSLVTINDKYFDFILNKNLFKSGIPGLSTEFESMHLYDGNYTWSNGYTYAYEAPEFPIDMWQTYKIDFYGATLDFVTSAKTEIVIAGGPSDTTPDTSSFVLFGSYSNAQLTREGTTDSTFYAQYANDPTHIAIIRTLLLRNDKFQEPTGAYNYRKEFFANYPPPTLYSKLILQMINPREFI